VPVRGELPVKVLLTNRGARMARILLTAEHPMTVLSLAQQVKASERAARYELDSLEDWFRSYGLVLERKRRIGVWTVGTAEDRRRALAALDDLDADAVIYGPEERFNIMSGWLLCAPEGVSEEEMLSALGVSRRTLYYDIERWREHAQTQGLELRSRKGQLLIEGDEAQCRQLLVSCLRGCSRFEEPAGAQSLQLVPVLVPDPQVGWWIERAMCEYGLSDAIRDISHTLNRLLDDEVAPFDMTAARTTVLEIMACIVRVQQGRELWFDPVELKRLVRRYEWRVACEIGRLLESKHGIALPPADLGYVALSLSLLCWRGAAKCPPEDRVELRGYTEVIVEEAAAFLGVQLDQDHELRTGLMAHLYAALERLRAGFPARNNMLDEIRLRFPQIHAAARRAAERVGRMANVTIPEDEVGWITLHLGAALQRMAQHNRAWTGLAVCHCGLGAANVLKARLESEFPQAELRVVAAANRAYLRECLANPEVDVVISTVELPPSNVPVVVVSPFLTTGEIYRIAASVYTKRSSREEDLLNACRFRPAGSRAAAREHSGKVTLMELLRGAPVRLGVHVNGPEEAIRAAGEVLLERGIVTTRYLEAMVNLYQEMGSYIVVAPGVAVPHAPPEDGALGFGLGIVTLAAPVQFGSPGNDPVVAVIALASADYSSHVRSLLALFQLLRTGIGPRMASCRTAEDLLQLMIAETERLEQARLI